MWWQLSYNKIPNFTKSLNLGNSSYNQLMWWLNTRLVFCRNHVISCCLDNDSQHDLDSDHTQIIAAAVNKIITTSASQQEERKCKIYYKHNILKIALKMLCTELKMKFWRLHVCMIFKCCNHRFSTQIIRPQRVIWMGKMEFQTKYWKQGE